MRYRLRYLNVESFEQALELITRVYPLERFPRETPYALEKLVPRRLDEG